MSLELASRLFDWSSIALAVGACIVFIATAAIVWLGIVKEHHWDVLREHSNEKIAAVGLEAAKANAELGAAQADIAKAHVAIAEATARAAEANQKAEEERLARVKLEARMAPRVLVKAQQDEITENIKDFKIRETTLMASPATAENEWFVRLFGSPLIAAGWNVKILPGTATAAVLLRVRQNRRFDFEFI